MADRITTVLEVLAILLLAAAGGVAVARYSVAGGLAAAGMILLVCSALITARARPRRPVAPSEDAAL